MPHALDSLGLEDASFRRDSKLHGPVYAPFLSMSPRSDLEDARQGLFSPPPLSRPDALSCPCRSIASESSNPRNLVVCIDGTSNKFGIKNTNVIELYSQIKKSDRQLTYYNSGIGTYARPSWRSFSYWKQWMENKIDLAIAWNLEAVIMGAYRWLADNYREGDRIFMFGFSRGAYQARAVAGMIAKVGLLLPGNNEQIPFAFELYACLDDSTRRKNNEDDERAKVFKRTFCRPDVSIHFVGAWDTVSSVGPFRGRTLPFTTSCQHICMFRHALALDERRVKFLPEYVYGGNSVESTANDSSYGPRVKEVWFPGTHSDVGGGNRPNHDLQMGGISLLWMKKEAESAGLEFIVSANNHLTWLKDIERPPTESLKSVWWLLEALPIKHLSYNGGSGSKYARGPHLGDPRVIVPGQQIHVSALFQESYTPRAIFQRNWSSWPEKFYWNEPSSPHRLKTLDQNWEKELFHTTAVRALLAELARADVSNAKYILDLVDRLAFMAKFENDSVNIQAYDLRDKLKALLRSADPLIRLSTAVMFCQLDLWDSSQIDLSISDFDTPLCGVATKAIEMLQSDDVEYHVRACAALHPLCQREALRARILTRDTLDILLDAAYHRKNKKAQFYSIQALSLLLQIDGTSTILQLQGGPERFIKLLHHKNQLVAVAVLRAVTFMLYSCPVNTEASQGFYNVLIANDVIRAVCELLQEYSKDLYVLSNVVDLVVALAPHDRAHSIIGTGLASLLAEVLEDWLVSEKEFIAKSFLRILDNDALAESLVDDGLVLRLLRMLLSASTFKEATDLIIALTANARFCRAVDKACHDIVDVLEGSRPILGNGPLYIQVLYALSRHGRLQVVYALSKLLKSKSPLVDSVKDLLLRSIISKRITRMLCRGMLISKKAKKLSIDGAAVAKGLLDDGNIREKVVTDELMASTFEMLSDDDLRHHLIGITNLSILVVYDGFHPILAQKATEAVDDLVEKSREDNQRALQALLALAGIELTRQTVVVKLKALVDHILVAENAPDIVGELRIVKPFLRIDEIRELVLEKNVNDIITKRCDEFSPKEGKGVQKAVLSFSEELHNFQSASETSPVSDDGISVASSVSRILVDDE